MAAAVNAASLVQPATPERTAQARWKARMQAEIISIGDEITSGQRLDTNSQWLSQQLGQIGIRTARHTTVGDHLAENIDALQSAARRADIIVCTGGLGPTLDDLTRQAMADAFDSPLRLDESSLQHIEEMFSRRGRQMPERNRLQAMFPQGSQVIPNPHGSAPGIDLCVSLDGRHSRIFALPGVPAEMKQMWRATVIPRLELLLGFALGQLRYHSLKVFGIGESDVEVVLPDLIDRNRTPTVGITVSRATITLRIAARAHSDQEFRQLISPTIGEIQAALSDLIFGEGDDELEHVVLRQLSSQGLTLASVEVGAASWVSDWMLKASGENDQYAGGAAFASLQSAQHWLSNDNRQQLDSANRPENESMAQVWKRLACQARDRFHADVGLAFGHYPTIAQMETTQTPFHCVFAVAFRDQTVSDQRSLGGHPDVLGPRIAKTALDFLRKQLIARCAKTTA